MYLKNDTSGSKAVHLGLVQQQQQLVLPKQVPSAITQPPAATQIRDHNDRRLPQTHPFRGPAPNLSASPEF